MSLKQTIKDYLEIEPKARERRNKDRALVNVLLKRHPKLHNALEQRDMTKDDLIAIVQDFDSLNRFWRMILKECPELRGSDYDDKDGLESDHLKLIGYRVPNNIGPGEAVEENVQPTLL